MRLSNLNCSFGDKTILENFSFDLPRDKIVCLWGKSGIGKTTFFNVIAGLTGASEPLKGYRIAYLFQESRLLEHFSALDNVAAVTDREKARYWLDAVGLGDDKLTFPGEMSGGMERSVAIARFLAYDGEINLIDEPFSGIDVGKKARLISLMRPLFKGKYTILITHDIDTALAMADLIYLADGTPLHIYETIEFSESNKEAIRKKLI